MNLKDRVAIITGASRGLGREIARLYAQNGARLVLVARGKNELDEAASELSSLTEVILVAVDVSQNSERIVEAALERFGRVDILVNNASALGPSPMPELEEYPWREVMRLFRVNAVAPLHLIQQLLPEMKTRGEGIIINVTSDAGVEAYRGWGGYGASKAALEHLSRVLANELEGTGIQIFVVDPGDMDTGMHRRAEPGVDLSHLPGPEVIAPVFVHLVESGPAESGRFQASQLLTQLEATQ